MNVPDDLKQQALKLLKEKASERAVADATKLSRRQVRTIKQQMSREEDHNPLASSHQPTMSRPAAITELVKLSTRPGGVRHSEMWPVLRDFFGLRRNDKTWAMELDMTDNQLRYLKEKTVEAATSKGKEALFIPEWLPRRAPAAANDTLINMAGWLHDHALEYVSEFMSAHPDASRMAVFRELIYLSFPQASPEPIQTRCQRNTDNADKLQRRLGDLAGKPAANEPFPPDVELNRLCI